jgi:hypothetical protein
MGTKVVSTKLTEEEYGKLVGLCSASGFTVSRLLKRAILERMNEEGSRVTSPTLKPVKKEELGTIQTRTKNTLSEERFQYY